MMSKIRFYWNLFETYKTAVIDKYFLLTYNLDKNYKDQLETIDWPARLKERDKFVGLFLRKSFGFCKIWRVFFSY